MITITLDDVRNKIKATCGENRYSCSGCKWSVQRFKGDKYNLACYKGDEFRLLVLVKDYDYEKVRLVLPSLGKKRTK